MRNQKIEVFVCWIVSAWFMLGTVPASAQTITLEAKILQQLQETINQQQEQLGKQSAQIQAQGETLKAVQQQLDDLKQETTGAQTQAAQALSTAQQTATASQKSSPSLTVASSQERVKLAISGQLNRAVNVINDGAGTDVYFVDNDISNSRVRFVGSAQVNDETTLGARLEIGMSPDDSRNISQSAQATSTDFFDQRWADVSIDNKRFGKLSLGKGDTASNNTAEVDLSKTEIVQNSSITDIASGMLFREEAGDHELTKIKLGDAFNSRDGLTRQSRLRYDTPTFAGFSVAGSLISNERSDAAIFWGGQGYGFKAAAAVAIANPNLDMDKYGRKFGLQQDGSFSILHSNSGLNLTVAAALLDVDNQKDMTTLFTKLGWTTTPFACGPTAFGVAYTRSANLPAEDDIGYSASAAMVQSFDKYGTELYFQFRRYLLNRHSGPEVEDLNVGTIGTRVKF